MNPKPFWPLNHFTVPVVIVFSKARKRIPPDDQAVVFNFVDVFGKGARGRIQQGTAANRTAPIYTTFASLQGIKSVYYLQGASAVPTNAALPRFTDLKAGVVD
ncbi:hypothetical protein ACVOMS_10940 [Bradyrhizobium guangxiense]|jgi:hypothetical protein